VNFELLSRGSLSLFEAIGGWRTVAETVASKSLFLVAYLLTDHVTTSAIVAVSGVAVLALVHVCTDRKHWQAVIGLLIVGVSALMAGSSGRGVDFYLLTLVVAIAFGAVFLASMLVRWPVIGLVVGTMRGERTAWRRDHAQRRRYMACTGVFVAKFALEVLVLTPLYVADQVAALGIAATLLATPATAGCAYLCWRILRSEAAPA
jgi:hypothetical protein